MSESGTIANGGALLDKIHLTERGRIIAYSGLLLAVELIVALYFIAATHGWLWQLPAPVTTDFVSFYAAGSLVDAGTPALAYHREAHYAAEQIAATSGIEYNYFYYPPIFLLLCGLLARLPYLSAFLLFEGLTLGLYLFVTRKILGEREWSALIPVLAFPAVLWNIGLGQNALLTAVLFGGAIFFVDRRPVLAGLLFGALCYKPQFGLLVPVALAAGRNWRAFAAAGSTVIALGSKPN
jgi:alpha-1,2-mannosyltransferase